MLASTAIARLADTLPTWLAFPKVEPGAITGFAAPRGSAWQQGMLDITILPRGAGAIVRETQPARLPGWCPELHLNADRSFCLGLDQLALVSPAAAAQWWADLEVHLRLLAVALTTRVWPQHSALDHGDAGALQREAMALAQNLRLEEAYACARAGEPSWISDLEFDLVGADGVRGNGAAPCPCGCARRDGQPYARRVCPRRHKVARLILLERARRLALADFWKMARAARCCGAIRDCPLTTGMLGEPDPELLARTRRALRRTR